MKSVIKIEEIGKSIQELTFKVCKVKCKSLGSCCDATYCESAIQAAAKDGVVLQKFEGNLPLLNSENQCTAPARYKPLCVVHQCDIQNFGEFEDSKLTDDYFKLREGFELEYAALM